MLLGKPGEPTTSRKVTVAKRISTRKERRERLAVLVNTV
jgi:hypothetical protein